MLWSSESSIPKMVQFEQVAERTTVSQSRRRIAGCLVICEAICWDPVDMLLELQRIK
jgi:hypothetical protein